jgi:hypothetical protein
MGQGQKKKTKKARVKPNYQVFITHATADKWVAKVICEKVESVGASTFRDDRDIDGGDNIPERIRMEIKRSKELIVLMTPASVNRPWVLLEVGAAWGWRKDFRIVPVLYHVDVEPIPEMIKAKKVIFLNDFDTYVAEIKRRVHKLRNG